ncbi:hypothetical protein FBU30_003580 [Linnemannia zychae]|nr:hypothetical protein FBU30_003580 [Linnemannia zychae]
MFTITTRQIRIAILVLVVLITIFGAASTVLFLNIDNSSLPKNVIVIRKLSTIEILNFVAMAFLILIYAYASIPKLPAKAPRFVRAFFIFAFTVFILYIHVNVIANVIENHGSCSYAVSKASCHLGRTANALGMITGFLIMYEVARTLRETDPNPTVGKLGGEAIPTSAPYQGQMTQPVMNQQFPPQTFQQGVFYPQQQPYPLVQQQPLQGVTPKFEVSAQQQQQFQPQVQQQYQLLQQQQPFYQSPQPGQQPMQQVQQIPYSQQPQQNIAPLPPVPGSLVTTTPQPGGQAIAPYSSPGVSVAVSPVLPVGGYSTPSPSVGHQSPVHPPQ